MSDGVQTFRISLPGNDANVIGSKMVFATEGEYLKVHAVIDEPYIRNSRGSYYGTWGYPDLGYIPLVYVSIVQASLGRVFFPGDQYPASSGMISGWGYIANSNRIWAWNDEPGGAGDPFRIRAIVFKNKAVDYIS